MNNIIIGTAGHVDHGKTSLIRALTGIDADRLEEEKRRGITIELGFAFLDLPNGERAGIVDVPGHEKFIRNMLAGAGGIDIALIVIAADEGIMPQTREHMEILELLNIKRGVIAVTKTDLVEPEWLELVMDDIRSELRSTQWERCPMYPVSASTGEGVEALRAALFALIDEVGSKRLDIPFRLPVDRVFSMQGFGTVVTGTLIEGTLAEGQEVTIYPDETPARIRSIQVHSTPEKQAFAGQRVAINLQRTKKEELERGAVVAAPGSMKPSMMLDVKLRVLKDSDWSIKNGSRVHFYHGSAERLAKAVLLGGVEELAPGDECFAQLRFDEAVAAKAGDRFVVRFYSPIETIGGGEILDPCPYKHKARDAEAVKHAELLSSGGADDKLEALMLERSPNFVEADSVRVQSGLSPEAFRESLGRLTAGGRLVRVSERVYLHEDFVARATERLRGYLAKYHEQFPLKPGAKRAEAAGKLFPGADRLVSDGLADVVAARGAIVATASFLALPGFEVKLTPAQKALSDELTKKYELAAFTPPERSALASEYAKNRDFERVFGYLMDAGVLVPVDAELCFTSQSLDKAEAAFRALAENTGEVTLAEFRDALGASRKYAMAILDFWDKKGLTKKNGDARTIKGRE